LFSRAVPPIVRAVIVAALLLLASQATLAQQIDSLALRAHTRFLSDDALKGRGTGTPEERIAATYIESQLRALGLAKPAGSNSYFQPLPLRRATIDSARLVLNGASGTSTFSAGEFLINTGGERALRSFAGDALFVGTSEHALAATDAELRGRVLVLLGTLGADAARLIPRWLAAGVSGAVLLIPDSAQYDLFAASRGDERYFIAGDVNEPIWQSTLPVVLAGPAVMRVLLAPMSGTLSGLSRGAFQPVPIDQRVEVTVHATVQPVSSRNVLGVIPGSDPRRAGEYVIFTAHYDHLGVSAPDARGDSIYNGFSDNAAGVAMLLAIAQRLVHDPPARSVGFLFLSGEERGLLGSTYYVEHPLIPLARTNAVVNLDGGAPSAPPVEWRLAGGTNSPLGAIATEIGARHGWKIDLSPASPNSDYWPFVAHNVQSVFLIPGNRWENLTSQQRDALRARWDRYHRPDDEWAEDFPFRGLQRYAQLALEIGLAAAKRP
jgi:hypothetical protein